jgi:hypothetical protein
MGLWKQLKASRRATALGLDGYMLWEKPHRCPTCKNTKWDIHEPIPMDLGMDLGVFYFRPVGHHSTYVCLVCARVLPVCKDSEYNQLFFKPFPWRILDKPMR